MRLSQQLKIKARELQANGAPAKEVRGLQITAIDVSYLESYGPARGRLRTSHHHTPAERKGRWERLQAALRECPEPWNVTRDYIDIVP